MKPFFRLLLFFAACSFQASASPADTVLSYFDKDWKETDAGQAAYYRKAWQENKLWMVRDYFMSGRLQMSGAFSDDSLHVHEGPFSYYYENGQLSKTAVYTRGKAEGPVKDWYDDGKLQQLVNYKNGNADGIARMWYRNGRLADSTIYKDGHLDGMQFWYFDNGQVSEEGIYSADSPMNTKLWTIDGKPDSEGAPNQLMPSFVGRDGQLLAAYLGKKLTYPKKARRKEQEGRAIIQFLVRSDGTVTDCFVAKSSGTEQLDEEALRVVCGMPHWRPGRYHNRPTNIWFTLPVTFKLD